LWTSIAPAGMSESGAAASAVRGNIRPATDPAANLENARLVSFIESPPWA
jgi:hypothetical protein